jgi:hypothetical protein
MKQAVMKHIANAVREALKETSFNSSKSGVITLAEDHSKLVIRVA